MEELHKVIAGLFEKPERIKEDVGQSARIDHFEGEKQAFFTPGTSDQK
jgi:hypothetical protein